jgi:hypothetical protein
VHLSILCGFLFTLYGSEDIEQAPCPPGLTAIVSKNTALKMQVDQDKHLLELREADSQSEKPDLRT